MSQLERAARALHAMNDRKSKPQFRCAWDDCLPAYREILMAEARAVIASIEPDDAMVEAAAKAIYEVDPAEDQETDLDGRPVGDVYPIAWESVCEFQAPAVEAYRAMARAALTAGLRALLAEGEGRTNG
jgi:hypothetical protein